MTTEVAQNVDSVRRSAANALWELNDDLAISVLEGLVGNSFISGGRMVTSSGLELASFGTHGVSEEDWSVKRALFGPTYEKKITISSTDQAVLGAIGYINVTVDPSLAYIQFGKRAAFTFFGGLLKSALVSAILYGLFYFTITQPLSALTQQINATDPTSDRSDPVIVPPRHAKDELGQIATSTNQQGMEIRRYIARLKQAERDLRISNDGLESRINLRTAELNEALKEAETANKVKSDFLANVSHELRTPLNAIIGFSSMMMTETFGRLNERYKSYAYNIKDSGENLLELINDILDISKVEAGQMVLHREPVDLAGELEDCVKMLKPLLDEKFLHVTLDFDRDCGCVNGDKVRLRQVCNNLLSNAIKFSPENGTITLSVRKSNTGGLEMEIKDQGPGILDTDLPLVFEPFTQLQGSDHQGTGLGLSIVLSLLNMHKFDIQIDSEVGHGTAVIISVPDTAIVRPATA